MSTKQEQFGRWLTDELKSRGLSREQFAIRSGLSKGTINALCNATHDSIRTTTIHKVSKALRMPEQRLLEMAGVVPELSQDETDLRLLQFVYHHIDDDKRRTLLRFAEFLRREHEDELNNK